MKTVKALIIALALTVGYLNFIMPLKGIVVANLKISDILFSIAYKYRPLPRDILNKMVLVAIDDESFKNMNLRWPWSRGVIAGMVKNISECSPRAICLDLMFMGKSTDENQDLAVAKAVMDAKNVFAGAYFGDNRRYIIPEDVIAKSLKDFGFIDKPRDADSFSRRAAPYMLTDPGNVRQYCLTFKLAAYLTNRTPDKMMRDNPRLEKRYIYINYYGKMNKFLTIPAWKIFKADKEYLTRIIKDKTVFVGTTSELIHDIHPTRMGLMSGVVMLMNETAGYITGDFLYNAGWSINFFIIFLFVFAAILAETRLRLIHGIIFFAFDLAAFFAVSLFAFLRNTILDYFGVLFLVIFSALFFYTHKYVIMIVENAALKNEAITDGLTHLYLYRYFELCLKRELKKTVEGQSKLAMVFYDIDHFKNINDTYGHEFGNLVLVAIAKTLKENSRDSNILTRYGGEEFCALLPETSTDNVVIYAERIRSAIKKLEFKTDKAETVKITISGGIVTSDKNKGITNHTDFIKAADRALYRSKNTGRDKIIIYDKSLDGII